MKGFNFINIKIKDLILHKASQNFIIIAAVAGFQIITNVIVGRELSKDDFGKYSFVFLNVINVLSVLFLFGQPAPILRLLSMNKIEELKWKKVILLFLLTISIPLLIASYIVACYYNLGNMWFIVISVGSFFMCCTLVIGTIIRAQGNFNKAVLIERANPVLFMILLSIVYLTSDVDLFIVSVLKIISMFFGFCYLLYIIVSWKEGKNKISKNIISEGLVLWEMGLTVLVCCLLYTSPSPRVSAV
ncbi:MAG: hypothetical protein QUS13_07090, partial [Smithella sp.]|nr:hypothetical protein [Smithella sp.]